MNTPLLNPIDGIAVVPAVAPIRRHLDEPVMRDANRRGPPSSLANRAQAIPSKHKVTP